jgi:hypothetical protein
VESEMAELAQGRAEDLQKSFSAGLLLSNSLWKKYISKVVASVDLDAAQVWWACSFQMDQQSNF